MKQLHLLFSTVLIGGATLLLNAQTDVTDKIVNPGFEDNGANVNLPEMPLGWTWTGTDGYVWCGVNNDAEDTAKTGDYIAGTWNQTFGDVELSQTITGLDNGTYKVTCDLMGGSRNGTTSRMTTQRLFANNKCMLYGADTASSYSAENLAILETTEEYSFGGYAEFQSDRTPFETLTVEVEVTDGALTLGVRTNGAGNQLGYTFPHLTAGDGYGWFKVDNFTLTYMGSGTGISKYSKKDGLNIIVNEGYVSVIGVEKFEIYNICGNIIPSDQQLGNGIYIIKANENYKKIVVR